MTKNILPSFGFLVLLLFLCLVTVFFYWIYSPNDNQLFKKHYDLFVQSYLIQDNKEAVKHLIIITDLEVDKKKKSHQYLEVSIYYSSIKNWQETMEYLFLSLSSNPDNVKAYFFLEKTIKNIDNFELIARYINKLINVNTIDQKKLVTIITGKLSSLDEQERQNSLTLLDKNIQDKMRL